MPAAVAAFLAIAVLALALVLPRIAASAAVRARLIEAVQDATKREFSVREIRGGLFPPHLELVLPSLAGEAGAPSAAARSAELRLAVLPLLARAVVVRSLVVEEGAFHLVRDAEGLRLAGADLPEQTKPERTEAPQEKRSDDGGFALAVQRVMLRGAALRLDDRTLAPAPRLDLRDLELELRGAALDAPIDVALEGALADGGTLSLSGTGRREGPFEAKLALREVALAPFSPYAGGARLPARVTGTVEASGTTERLDRLKLALELADSFGAGGFEARGPVSLRADLEGDPRAPHGGFELDATRSELVYGSALAKPAGRRATAVGTLRRERAHGASTLRLEAVDLTLGSVRARAEVELAPRREITLDAKPFDAAALGELVPALAARELAGRLSLEGLRIAVEPFAVRGTLRLDPLALAPAPGAEALLAIRGALEGEGEEVVGRGLRLVVAGEAAPLTLRLADLAKRPRFELATQLDDADSGALVAAFGGDRDRLSGPLDLDARLSGPLAAGEILRELRGGVSLRIAPGRLRKVSLLKAAFAAAGGVQAARGKPSEALGRYTGDEFQSLSGHFRLAGGSARTDDLRLVYPGYAAALEGRIGLTDRALDLRGALELDPEADRALAAGPGRQRTIPLARVGGTLDSPELTLSNEALAGVAAAYAGDDRRRAKWERKLDDRLGDGQGKQVLDALDKVLESLQKPAERKPEPE